MDKQKTFKSPLRQVVGSFLACCGVFVIYYKSMSYPNACFTVNKNVALGKAVLLS